MFVKTTINIETKILDKISSSAYFTEVSRTKIIKLLLARVIRNNQKMVRSNHGIMYQDRDDSNNWHRFHIIFRIDEYEYCLDMRKLFKMSLSRILAYAVMKYMQEIVQKLKLKDYEEIRDNYSLKNYIIIHEMTTGVICWRLYWGIPRKLPDIVSN